MKIKKIVLKFLASSLSVLLLFSSFSTTALAALNIGSTYAVTENDSHYEYISGWGEDGTIASLDEREWSNFKIRSVRDTNEPLYCLEFGKAFWSGDAMATSIEEVSVYTSLPAIAQDGIKLTSIYGYPNYTYGVNAEAAYYASQIISWEYQLGYRVGAAKNNPKQGLYGADDINNKAYRFYNGIEHKKYQDVLTAYTGILTNIANHSVKPSFATQTSIKLNYNPSTKQYEKTLEDTNGVLSNYNISVENTNLNYEVNGNHLTLFSTVPLNSGIKLSLEKKGTCTGTAVALKSQGDYQITLYGSMEDPVRSNIAIKTDALSSINITKTAEDNKISDIEFLIESKEIGYSRTAKTNSDGNANLSDLIPGYTYTVTEINVKNEYQTPPSQSFVPEAGKNVNLTFNNVLKKGTLEINKFDGSTKKPLAGVTFAIYTGETTNNVYAVLDSNNEGKVILQNIPVGNYSLQEISAPEGYIVDETLYHFSITETNQKIVYNFDNYNATGIIKILKTSSSSTIKQPLTGAKFDVYAAQDILNTTIKANDKVLEGITTDQEGKAETSPLNFGEYYLIETKAPDGYAANFEKKHYITLKNSVATLEIKNIPIILNLLKLDSLDQTPIANVSFSITNESGNAISTVMSDKNGIATVYGLSYGKYTIKETMTPDGYLPDDKNYCFEIVQNNVENAVPYNVISEILEDGQLIIRNTPTVVTLQKTDASNGKTLSNVPFDLFDEKTDAKIGGYVTNETGKIVVNKLKTNTTYTFRESGIVDGYYANDTKYLFKINSDGDTIYNGNVVKELNVTNIPTQYKIYKTDSITKAPIEGVGFAIYRTDNTLITTGKTDSSGCLVLNKLPVGKYYFVETIFPAGYIQNSNKEYFNVDSQNDMNYQTISNVPTTVVLNKIDKLNGKPLADALIGIYDSDDKEVSRIKTNEKGKIILTYLPVGSYTYKELQQPNGYQLDQTVYNFTLHSDGTVTNSKPIENVPTEVVITKINEDKDPLAGAKIGIYNSNNELVFEGKTNELGELKIYYLERGTYTYKELEAPKGYQLNTETYKFTIDENGVSTTDNIIVNVTTNVVITKLDTENSPLEHAKIAIFDSDNKKIFEEFTNKKGQISIQGLYPGIYTYLETAAPNGYQLNTKIYTFEVLVDGSVKGDNVIVNKPTKVVINKVNDNGEVLSNSTIGVFNKESEMIFSGKTNDNGQIIVYNLPTGKYTFKELLPCDGYELNENVYSFSIDKNGLVEGDNEIINQLSKIVINKTDELGNPLANSIIGIYKLDGTLVDEGTTDQNGNVTFLGLLQGNYYYSEIKAPDGYILNEIDYPFSINDFGKAVGEFNLMNQLVPIPETIEPLAPSTEIPKTGTSNLLFFITPMMCISAVAFLLLKKKKIK